MPYLLPSILAQTIASPDIEGALDALEGAVLEVLADHDARYTQPGRVARHVEDAVTLATARADRGKIMGSPARYVELLVQGDRPDSTPGVRVQGEGTETEGFDVAVVVYHGLETYDNRATVAETFRALLWGRTAAKPGLVRALRLQGYLETSAGELSLNVGPVTAPPLVVVDRANKEYRHEAAFVVTLTPC